MKYIRTYETEEKFLTDKDSTSRVFRLKPTLYKYSEAGDHVHLEIDDPRKHEGSTYMEITLDSDVEFSFYIGNKSGDTQTTMNCSIDWGDGTVETKTITKDDKGFKLSHNYKAGSYKIELYGVERDYVIEGVYSYSMGIFNYNSLISHPSSIKRIVLGSDAVSIKVGAFTWCDSLTSVYIPERVTVIGGDVIEGVNGVGGGVFKGCSSLKSINIPKSVVSMGYGMFSYCSSLTSIHIPEGVTSIEYMVFDGCSSLTSIHIPESVTSIGFSAFRGCSSLKSINIPEGVTSISEQVFKGCSSLKSINIPEGVTSIESNAFNGCTSLTSIRIPEGVTSIAGFDGCTGLTSINIPESVTTIGVYAFNGCSSLTSISIPEGVTTIGVYAFNGCSSLTSISIPEGVTSIGNNAFCGCTSLRSISSLNTTAPTLGTKQVFTGLPTNGTLHIKPGATGYDAWLSKLPSGWTIVEDL